MPDLGKYQSQIVDLPDLSEYRYENIFKVYKTADNQYWYNILKKVNITDGLNDDLFYSIITNQQTPWTNISYRAYQTVELWWLIMLVNKLNNPLIIPSNSTVKILKPEYVQSVISQIKQQLQ